MSIRVLAPDVISKIAAGEVIERPASVVKELVENSLDARATQIAVETQVGGARSIKVTDNGVGIPASEVELAFHRYATSKIHDSTDLGNISSLGFRGEALPSIAAVAEVEISTRTLSDTVGSYMYLRENDIARQESHARPPGTTITMHRLFHYFPARLKFLKSVNTENSHIARILSQYALAFPEVRFSLILDKHPSLQTTGNGDLRDVVNQIYGLEIARGMLAVKWRDTLGEISGLVSPPSLSRSNRSYLSFFVNRRWIYSPMLARATEAAYHGLLMNSKHPIAIINISLPPEEIDVNVHPTKAQVKFHLEQAVFASVEESVKGALTRAPIAKSKDMPRLATSQQEATSPGWQGQMIKEKEPAFSAPLPTPGLPIMRVMGQLANTYIIAEGPEGLYLIDQHAAHERILYERIMSEWLKQEVQVQGLLQPITIELSPTEEQTLEANKEILTQFGFTIDAFGDRSHLIRAVPVLMTKANAAEAVSTMLDNLASKDNPAPWEEKITESLACHSAIRGGQQLSDEEMRELISQLEQTNQPRTCPHGRPTMIHLSSHQLEREFGRVK